MGWAELFKHFVVSEQSKNILLETRAQQIHPSSVFLYTPYQVDLRESQSLQLSQLHHRRCHCSSFGLLESPVDCHYYLIKKEGKKRHFVQGCSIFGKACNDCLLQCFSYLQVCHVSLKNPTPFSPGEAAELYWYKDVLLVLNLQSRRIYSLSEKGSSLPPFLPPCKKLFFAGVVISYSQEEKRAVLESRRIHICFCFTLSFTALL